ncbi:MAG: carbonic anhydrase [Waddliaceae bacterium]
MKEALHYAKQHEIFHRLHFPQDEQLFLKLAEKGQAPKTLFIGCSDSRVIPELMTAAKPGDFFVIRHAGNFVPRYDPTLRWDGIAASIEYAVKVLNVHDIIVCGHSDCGAIKTLLSEHQPVELPLMQNWLKLAEEVKKSVEETHRGSQEKKRTRAEKVSVIFQLQHLLTYPCILERMKNNAIALHGWYFTIRHAQLEYFDTETEEFMPLLTQSS